MKRGGWDDDGWLPPPERCSSLWNWQAAGNWRKKWQRPFEVVFQCVCVIWSCLLENMGFQFCTRSTCTRERVVFQETSSLEISWQLGETITLARFLAQERIWQSHNWGSSVSYLSFWDTSTLQLTPQRWPQLNLWYISPLVSENGQLRIKSATMENASLSYSCDLLKTVFLKTSPKASEVNV